MSEMKPRANARPEARPAQRPAQRSGQRPAIRVSQAQLIAESRQPARLVLALVLLLLAFGGVIAKDHNFWFGSDDSDGYLAQPAAQQEAAKSPTPAIEARTVTAHTSATASATATKKTAPAAKKPAEVSQPAPAESAVVASNRTAVAPLDVEIVAGDSHRTVHPGSNATKVEIITPGSRTSALTAKVNGPTNAAELERVNTVQPALGSGDGTYPLLAQQMKVQGSVVLQAFIGSDGAIQSLHVLSGPAILASAAQQAVREWRFKPYMLNGQPVETKATITVNFTIKVADNSAAKTS
jgi:TonB family protein